MTFGLVKHIVGYLSSSSRTADRTPCQCAHEHKCIAGVCGLCSEPKPYHEHYEQRVGTRDIGLPSQPANPPTLPLIIPLVPVVPISYPNLYTVSAPSIPLQPISHLVYPTFSTTSSPLSEPTPPRSMHMSQVAPMSYGNACVVPAIVPFQPFGHLVYHDFSTISSPPFFPPPNSFPASEPLPHPTPAPHAPSANVPPPSAVPALRHPVNKQPLQEPSGLPQVVPIHVPQNQRHGGANDDTQDKVPPGDVLWDGWPDGDFEKQFTWEQSERTGFFMEHWANTNKGGDKHGNDRALTWSEGFKTRRHCMGVITCNEPMCKVITRPQTRRAKVQIQVSKHCLCGGRLQYHDSCAATSTLYSYRDGVYFVHRGTHDHP